MDENKDSVFWIPHGSRCLNIKTAVVWGIALFRGFFLIKKGLTALSWTSAAPVVIQSPCTSPCINRSKTDCCPELKRIIRCMSEYKTLRGFFFFFFLKWLISAACRQMRRCVSEGMYLKKNDKTDRSVCCCCTSGHSRPEELDFSPRSYQPLMWHSDRMRGGRQVWEWTETPQMLQILKGLISQCDSSCPAHSVNQSPQPLNPVNWYLYRYNWSWWEEEKK